MPVIDSRYGILIDDGKPTRVCQWRGCPRSDYTGRKMKVCARCTFVRYCSKDCQRLDWRFHRDVCRIPPLMDMGGWMEAYAWLWKWAAVEALEAHTDGWKILNHVLLVNVIRADRIAGPMPSPFLVGSARVLDMAEATRIAEISFLDESDFQKPLDIKQQGGMGLAIVLFVCAPRVDGPTSPYIFMIQRCPLHERPLGEHSGHRHLAQWEVVLKGVANGDIAISDISHMIESSPPAGVSTTEIESQLESMEL